MSPRSDEQASELPGVLIDPPLLYVGTFLGAMALQQLIVMHWGVVRREERYLEKKFGQVYKTYRTRVRRWL